MPRLYPLGVDLYMIFARSLSEVGVAGCRCVALPHRVGGRAEQAGTPSVRTRAYHHLKLVDEACEEYVVVARDWTPML